MAKIFLHYTCCLIVLTICVDQGDGLRKKRAEEIANRRTGAEFMRKKERIHDIVREIDLLKDMAEMVDHHIDDFYEEYPKENNKERSPKTRHYSHKSFHDWLTTERRPEKNERWLKTSQRWSNSNKKSLRDRLSSNFGDKVNDKQKNWLHERSDSNDDFDYQKSTNTAKTTTEPLNKYHEKIHNHGKQNLYQLSDSEYDLENRKFSKTTDMRTTTESVNNYHAANKTYEDEDQNLIQNIRTKSTPEILNKYYSDKHKYEGDVSNLYKNTKTAEKTLYEVSNQYHANTLKYGSDDTNFRKSIETTDKTAHELQNKYHANNKKVEDDDYNFHKNVKTTDKTISKPINKYHGIKQSHEDDDFHFHKNFKTTDKTTRAFSNNYHGDNPNHEDDDFDFHEHFKTTVKTKSRFLNNYHGNKANHEDDVYDTHKNPKSIKESTSEFRNKHYVKNKIFEDNNFNFYKNTKITNKTMSEIRNKYRPNKQNYENYNFDFQKNSHKPSSELVNKYNASNKRIKEDDIYLYKNAKASDKATAEFLNKYYAKKHKYEGKIFNKNIRTNSSYAPPNKYYFLSYESTKTTAKTTTEFPNKYNENNKKYEEDVFNFNENTVITRKTTSESSNKYNTNNKKIADDDFSKTVKTTDPTTSKFSNKYYAHFQMPSNSEDKLDSTKYSTKTRMKIIPVDEYYSKKYERAEKHTHKLFNIEEDPRDHGTEARSTTEYRKVLNLKEPDNLIMYKLSNFDSELKNLQPTEKTENKITIPLKTYYSKIDTIYKKYIQELSSTDDHVTKSPNLHASEINTTAETQSSQLQNNKVLSAALEEHYPKEHKHNDKVLYFTESRSSDSDLPRTTDIESTKIVPELLLSGEDCDSCQLSENEIKIHKTQKNDDFGTERTWPTFEHMLEEMGKKYDWRNDRWIELKQHGNQKMTNADFINNFQEKHKFSYSTIKLNSTKSRRNVVIAVTAVR